MEFSVVIPVYNEAQSLNAFHALLGEAVKKLPGDYEVIYVNDGSNDGSGVILKAFKEQTPKLRIITFTRNYGKPAAMCAGFAASRGRWIITLDGDGQNPPEEILKMVALRDTYDFAIGIRTRRKDSFLRNSSSWWARSMRKLLLGDSTTDIGCALRVFKREILGDFPFFHNFHRFMAYLVCKRGYTVREVPIAHCDRIAGKSKYTTLKRLREGLFDLCGVFWLKNRLIRYETNDAS